MLVLAFLVPCDALLDSVLEVLTLPELTKLEKSNGGVGSGQGQGEGVVTP